MKKLFGMTAALFLMLGAFSLPASAGNPCAMNPCNPCAMKHNPCNPCAMKKMNPCANPCAMKKMNPCAMKHNPCNPCAMKHK